MRFQVSVLRVDDEGWEATVTRVDPGPGADERVFPQRRIRRLAAGAGAGGAFPLPPEDEVARMPDNAPGKRLASLEDAGELRNAFRRLATGDAGDGKTIPAFGGYLFAALLGTRCWARIREEAGDERIERALRWSVDESELNRLPWEMMRDHDDYLVRERKPEVAITRIVAHAAPHPEGRAEGEDAELFEPVIAPRVLFVVGADPSDHEIRWGAEYLGMLRHLEREERGLLSKLLLRASPNDVVEAIERFKPSVVHFICHGRVEGLDAATLVLRSDDDPDRRDEQEVTAEQLADLIGNADPAPKVVVLNACHTGMQPPSEVSAPMCVQLVKSGVPVVVGMWGRVADRVCRMFTRRFYESLLSDRPIVSATADGRREGFVHGPDPDRNADWGFPCVFLSHRVHPDVTTNADEREKARRINDFASKFRILNDPPVFCDRFEIFKAAKHVFEPRNDQAVLVVREREPAGPDRKYGKTRLLAELAVQAVREDLAPCLVVPRRGGEEELPQRGRDLAELICDCLVETRAMFELQGSDSYVIDALLRGEGDLPLDIQSIVERGRAPRDDPDGPPPAAVAAAIRYDVVRLGEQLKREVLLLIDEVHRFGPGALDLLAYELLDPRAMAAARCRLPVVLTFGAEASYPGEFKRFQTTLRQRPRARDLTVDLLPFPQPEEDPLPYKQFLLLGGDRRYVVADDPSIEDFQRMFFSQLWDKTEGVPSKMTSECDELHAFVRGWAKTRVLDDATDEDELLLEGDRRP